jgi:hypothetical protein
MIDRLRHSSRLTAGVVGFLTTLAAAFFIGTYLGEGTHTGTAGSGGSGTQTLPMTINWPNGELTPTKPVALTAEISNTTTKSITFTKANFAISSGTSGCEPSWFEVVAIGTEASAWNGWFAGEAKSVSYSPGLHPVDTSSGGSLQLKMKETGTNQAACEGASITVTGKLS